MPRKKSGDIKSRSDQNKELKNGELKKYPEKERRRPLSRCQEVESRLRSRIKTSESELASKVMTPAEKELNRREREGLELWKNNPRIRKELSHQMGTDTHQWKLEQKRIAETLKNRREGKDFGIEVEMMHPDGKPVRLDYVDYQKDIIIDIKPLKRGESTEQLVQHYAEQRQRHIEAYEHTTGRQVLHYDYETYSSPSDLAEDV